MADYYGSGDGDGSGGGAGYGYGDSHGYGYGSGSGYGSGYGDGCGYGDGEGYGYGSGDGDGYGSAYGDGYGCCYGSGAGYGYGGGYGDGSDYYGSGTGYGDDVLVATLGVREVRAVITPWCRVVRVGCQVHSLSVWRERWREIARDHGVTVSAEEAARLIALIEEAPLGPEWMPSEDGMRA